jgi:hypothetical protein
MKRALFALASLTLGLLIVNGCNTSGQTNLSAQIKILDAEVREWTNPDDGKVYLAVAPTWKNEGPEPVRNVVIAAMVEGPNGTFPTDGEGGSFGHDLPKNVSPFAWYNGDPVEAGSTIAPTDDVESLAVLGLKEEVLAKTGANPRAKVDVFSANGEADTKPEEVPPPKP